MRFAVVTLGSTGDLHPFLGVARALVQRGHEVHLLSQAPYESQVVQEGVPFRAVVGAAEHQRTLSHPRLWHPLDGFGVLWRHLCAPAIEPTCKVLGELAQARQEPLVVFASPLAAGARFARERWPACVRLVSGYTAPMGLRNTEDPMFLGAWQVPRWLPAAARRGLWRALDQWKLEPMARPSLSRWQQAWQTPPINGSVFGDWLHSLDGGLALYPPWFAEVPAAWRARGVVQTGFPVYEPRDTQPLPGALLSFLERNGGVKPVVLYPGSAAGGTQRFLEMCLKACREIQTPVVVLSPHLHPDAMARLAPGGAGDDAIGVEQATLSLLLPRCAAFVHHGGIGSVAQAFAHGVPQLVLASAYDQFENGARVERLAAGLFQPLRAAGVSSIAQALRTILGPSRQAGWVRQDDPPADHILQKSCELLETRRTG